MGRGGGGGGGGGGARVSEFFHKESKSKNNCVFGGWGCVRVGGMLGGEDRWTDEQAQTNLPHSTSSKLGA